MTRADATAIAVEHVIYWRALRDYTVRQAGDALGVRFSKPGWDAVERHLVRWVLAHAEAEQKA